MTTTGNLSLTFNNLTGHSCLALLNAASALGLASEGNSVSGTKADAQNGAASGAPSTATDAATPGPQAAPSTPAPTGTPASAGNAPAPTSAPPAPPAAPAPAPTATAAAPTAPTPSPSNPISIPADWSTYFQSTPATVPMVMEKMKPFGDQYKAAGVKALFARAGYEPAVPKLDQNGLNTMFWLFSNMQPAEAYPA